MKTGAKIIRGLTTVPATAASAIKLGVIVGGTVSILQNTYRVSRGRIKVGEAAMNVAKDTLGNGLSAAAGKVIITGLGAGGLLGTVSFMTISGLSKGLWDVVVHGNDNANEEKTQQRVRKQVLSKRKRS